VAKWWPRRASSAAVQDAIPEERRPYGGTWEGIVGLVDVDPTARTKYSSTLTTSATAADINAALAAAGADQYVELASGTFTLSTGLVFNTNSKTLRGQVDGNGVPTTRLRFTDAGDHIIMSRASWDFGSSAGFTGRTVSSGDTRGSSTLTLTAAPTGLAAGRLMWINTTESGSDIDGGGGWTDFIGTKPWTQCVLVSAVSGNDVTFDPPINADYISSLTVQVHYRTSSDQIDYCGLENCIVEAGSALYIENHAVEMEGANQCWVRNCHLLRLGGTNSLRALLYVYGGYNVEMSHCRIAGFDHDTATKSSMYGMSGLNCSGLLIVNNVFTDTANVWPILMTSGSVFAYNYCYNMQYEAFQSQWVFDHGGANHFNLLEGNWIAGQHYMDDPTNAGNPSHSKCLCIVRERIEGYDLLGGSTTNVNCLVFILAAAKDATIAGCVMGTSGVQDAYNGGNGSNTGEMIGYIFNVNTATNATMLRLGNYNTFNGAIPSAETTAMDGGTIRDSYLYASKPSWFGACPWPWCDPSNFSQSNDPESLPAGYRETNGVDP
jgi:hypothetical protein